MVLSSHGTPLEKYGRVSRWFNLAAIAAFFGLALWLMAMVVVLGSQGSTMSAGWSVGSAWLAAWLAADLGSGLVHWLADNWGSPDWPVIGPALIRSFRHHHVAPEEITHHGFVELNGNNCLVSLPILAGGLYTGEDMDSALSLFGCAFWLLLAYFVLGTNQFHAWAHTPCPPRFVRWLQRSYLILPPRQHALHHRSPHNRYYCITTGWLNEPLHFLRCFEVLDAILAFLFRTPPRHRVWNGDLSSL